ncbi:MAG: hypothetical protein G3M78_00685 [Candidatus Nitrohelix vancouverensis]|uniref:Metal-dependent hydrolase n=1 Tax=Candidatus Nitrohelix vancouverensis TaxID=2705534 RepID=A0A7T0BZY2_9BACT|nr:MAG: hypothetical protein G3M78_00685 [Candidatus Nitrohelix vancouverensis]
MPDLISHAASLYVVKNCFVKSRVFSRSFFAMAMLGVFLPDIISRGVMKLFPAATMIAQYFHTPAACFFQALFISCLFVREQRYLVFWAITAGWVLHQVFDVFQHHLGPGLYFMLWPLYWEPIKIPLIQSTEWPLVAASTMTLAWVTGAVLARQKKIVVQNDAVKK